MDWSTTQRLLFGQLIYNDQVNEDPIGMNDFYTIGHAPESMEHMEHYGSYRPFHEASANEAQEEPNPYELHTYPLNFVPSDDFVDDDIYEDDLEDEDEKRPYPTDFHPLPFMPGGKVPAPMLPSKEQTNPITPEPFTPFNFSPQKLKKLFFKKDKEKEKRNKHAHLPLHLMENDYREGDPEYEHDDHEYHQLLHFGDGETDEDVHRFHDTDWDDHFGPDMLQEDYELGGHPSDYDFDFAEDRRSIEQ